MVCYTAQDAGAPHHGYIDKKKENVIFTPLCLGDTLSDWNHIRYRVSHQLGEPTSKFSLKIGTQKGSLKANSSIKFGGNMMNGSGFMIDYLRKARSIYCHTYRLRKPLHGMS